ncbi:MAG: aminotransferase class V-fold PLP-dependent enzyme [Bacteroidia bacterium]|nr:aminotransferase class V-fold PLP-dependent enzyme [Bacteroidia bacterium]
MKCQKDLFSLREGVHYLNCAYKAPLLKSAEEACLQALIRERNPVDISPNDFFATAGKVREAFGQIVNCAGSQVAILPSTSYGFASVLNNLPGKPGGHALTVEDEFPSGYFALERWAREHENELKVVSSSPDWNDKILNQIGPQTSVVLISSVHWMNGYRFDLLRIGARCCEVGARFIVDGTQSVGALPLDVQACQVDALVCATYKWLFGPYSMALAYVGDTFSNGKPLEESWMNRQHAVEFSALTQYQAAYEPQAGRFNVGESSNFLLLPMLLTSLKQIIDWNPAQIQAYAHQLIQPLLSYLRGLEVKIDTQNQYCNHLFSLTLPPQIRLDELQKALKARQISLSVRGTYLRIAVNVFNDENDILALIEAIEATREGS